jgi:glucose/arabinose dehydrogenase
MRAVIQVAALAATIPMFAAAQTADTNGAAGSGAVSAVEIERLASLESPWGMALLPDGRLLVTEKPGRLRIFADGKLSAPVANVPKVAYGAPSSEQGGLLDVAVDPEFAQNGLIYLSYSEEAAQKSAQPDPGDARFGPDSGHSDTRIMGGVVARAKLDGNRLTDSKVIWKQEPKTLGRGHFGHRLVFGPDGTLFITSGERMRFDPAQDLGSNLGKVVRINPDGSIPKDNPFVGRPGALGDSWSYGHRNMLAATIRPETGQLWVVEMGPLGGDELNLIERGVNYGWPVVSDGDNYDQSPIPNHRTRPEFKAPVYTWTPVIAPSGALFYDGSLFPWRGELIIGGLSSTGLVRLSFAGDQVKGEDRIDLQRRIRDVLQARDGSLLVLTDDRNGELLRLTPTAAGGSK